MLHQDLALDRGCILRDDISPKGKYQFSQKYSLINTMKTIHNIFYVYKCKVHQLFIYYFFFFQCNEQPPKMPHASKITDWQHCASVRRSVTLCFFSTFYAILTHFKLFNVNLSQFTFSRLVFWSFSLIVLTTARDCKGLSLFFYPYVCMCVCE